MANQLCDLQTNYLQNNSYQLILPRFPLVTFYSNNFVLPAMDLPEANMSTPYSDIKAPGDKITYQPFTFQFLVDGSMQNYREIQKWMVNISVAKEHSDFRNYSNRSAPEQTLGQQDAKVSILSGKSNPIAHITFYDAFPINLSGFDFTSQAPTTDYVMAQATFAYTYFDFDPQ